MQTALLLNLPFTLIQLSLGHTSTVTSSSKENFIATDLGQEKKIAKPTKSALSAWADGIQLC